MCNRIVDFERDPPPGVSNFGKIHIELWDLSGDMKYEKCWGPCQKDVQGIVFVYDPKQPSHEDQLTQLVSLFPKAMGLPPKYCMVFINHHDVGGGDAQLPKHTVPSCMNGLHKQEGTAEDQQTIYTGFEKYLQKLCKLLSEQRNEDEQAIMNT